MRISFKQISGLLILVIVTITYLAVSYYETQNTSAQVKEIYFADRMTAAHRILIDRYNKLHEGKIKVIPIDFPNDDFSTNERKELLARSLRGRGNGIDVFAVDIIWVQRFAKWGEPLDKYFKIKDKSKILDIALKSCYSDGEMVAVPLDMVQGVMYYRQDLLKKLKNGRQIIDKIEHDITWSDFIKLKSEINSKDPFYIFPAADYEGFVCSFMEKLLSLNPDYFQQDGFNFETPDAEKALQLSVDMINKYKLSPYVVTSFTEPGSYAYFIKNDGLFLRGWTSYDKDFVESPYNIKKQNELRKAPLPYFKDGSPASILGGWDVMVSKFSDKKKEAVDFIKFLISNSAQEIFYKQSAFYPIVKDFYEDPAYLKKYPEIKMIKPLLKTAVRRPDHAEYTKYSKIMSYYFNKALKKEISVHNALINCTKAIQLDKLILR